MMFMRLPWATRGGTVSNSLRMIKFKVGRCNFLLHEYVSEIKAAAADRPMR
jgi:hypothetical protein